MVDTLAQLHNLATVVNHIKDIHQVPMLDDRKRRPTTPLRPILITRSIPIRDRHLAHAPIHPRFGDRRIAIFAPGQRDQVAVQAVPGFPVDVEQGQPGFVAELATASVVVLASAGREGVRACFVHYLVCDLGVGPALRLDDHRHLVLGDVLLAKGDLALWGSHGGSVARVLGENMAVQPGVAIRCDGHGVKFSSAWMSRLLCSARCLIYVLGHLGRLRLRHFSAGP